MRVCVCVCVRACVRACEKNSHCEPYGVTPGSSSGGRFDQPCNLFVGAIPAQVLY